MLLELAAEVDLMLVVCDEAADEGMEAGVEVAKAELIVWVNEKKVGADVEGAAAAAAAESCPVPAPELVC